MVEFGHTVYIAKDGSVKQMGLGDLINADELYVEGIGLGTIREKIATITDDKNYSYEGIVGYVSNFDFNFNLDGSYDCSIQITSALGLTPKNQLSKMSKRTTQELLFLSLTPTENGLDSKGDP